VHAVRGHYRRHEYVAERRQDEQAKEQLKRLREAAAARAAQFGLPAPPPGYTFVSPFMRGPLADRRGGGLHALRRDKLQAVRATPDAEVLSASQIRPASSRPDLFLGKNS
jgi:hypothetical protein